MKKLLLSICTVLFVFSASLSAVEWGGVFKDETGISAPEITFKQSNSLSLWLNAPLGQDSGFVFSTEAFYKYNLEISKDEKTFENIADLTLLKVAGDIQLGEGLFSLSAGRFSVLDATGAVFAQTSDGLMLSYALSRVKLGFYAGYTGLLNELNVPMGVMSESDNKVYNLAYPYIPLGLTVALPSLFLNQNLTLQGYGLIDLGEDKSNCFYANLVFAGPITNIIYYNLSTSFGSVNFKSLMNYTGLTFYVFPTDTITVTGGLDFGSADQGKLAAFTSASVKSTEVESKITPKLGFTYGNDVLCADLGAKFLLEYADEKYNASGINLSASFVYNIFSDLQLGLDANASIDLTEAKQSDYTVKLNVSLAF